MTRRGDDTATNFLLNVRATDANGEAKSAPPMSSLAVGRLQFLDCERFPIFGIMLDLYFNGPPAYHVSVFATAVDGRKSTLVVLY